MFLLYFCFIWNLVQEAERCWKASQHAGGLVDVKLCCMSPCCLWKFGVSGQAWTVCWTTKSNTIQKIWWDRRDRKMKDMRSTRSMVRIIWVQQLLVLRKMWLDRDVEIRLQDRQHGWLRSFESTSRPFGNNGEMMSCNKLWWRSPSRS